MPKALKQTYASAGVKNCLLTFFQPGVEVFYATPQLDTISTLGLSFQEGLSVLVQGLPGNAFSETQTAGNNGELYLQQVSLSHPGLNAQRRTLLHELSIGRVHALVQDMNGQWWLAGQRRGLKLRFKSDTDAGAAFTLSGLEQEPARMVAASLIPSFLHFLA